MVILYFSCDFDVVVQGGELCLPVLPMLTRNPYPILVNRGSSTALVSFEAQEQV